MATSLDKYHAALDLHKQINADRESWVVEKAGLEKSATVRRLYLYIIGRPKTQLGIAFTKEMSKDKDRDTQIVALQNLGEYKLINDGSGGSGANSRPR